MNFLSIRYNINKNVHLNNKIHSVIIFLWISTMMSSVKSNGVVPFIESVDDFDDAYPNYFAENDKLALLLDFDGTLAAITAHPNDTVMTKETCETLTRISNNPKVFMAIISGRGLDDVKDRVGLDDIVYAGNHGLEILYPDGTKYDYAIPIELQENFTKMFDILKKKIEKNGAWIENKRASLTVHYRQAPLELHEEINANASEIIREFGYIAHQAHMAIEAKPPVEWNKGRAALYILETSFGSDWHEEVKVVFAGDDTTDEDAMKALNGKGISFRVANDPKIRTNANYRLESTDDVLKMLQWIEKYYD